jgi:hypothetical protein
MAIGSKRQRGKPVAPSFIIAPTRRFCVICQEMRTFRFNPVVGHSRCEVCDSGFARQGMPSKLTKTLHCFGCMAKTEHKRVPSRLGGIVMECGSCKAQRRK